MNFSPFEPVVAVLLIPIGSAALLAVLPGYRTQYGPFLLSTYTWYLNQYLDGNVHADWREKRGFAGGSGNATAAGAQKSRTPCVGCSGWAARAGRDNSQLAWAPYGAGDSGIHACAG